MTSYLEFPSPYCWVRANVYDESVSDVEDVITTYALDTQFVTSLCLMCYVRQTFQTLFCTVACIIHWSVIYTYEVSN